MCFISSDMKCENGMILGDNISFFYTKSPLSQFKNKTTISINVCTQLVVTPYALLEKDEEGKYDSKYYIFFSNAFILKNKWRQSIFQQH